MFRRTLGNLLVQMVQLHISKITHVNIFVCMELQFIVRVQGIMLLFVLC